MSKWTRIVALTISVIALVILAYAVLTPEPQTDGTDRPGMWSDHMTYSTANVGLIAVSIAAIVIALMIVLLWKEYEPLPPSMGPPTLHPPAERAEPASKRPDVVPEPPKPSKDEEAERDYLVLRLLTGDERVMFKAVMDAGGEALQKDLIAKTKMSNAKVSRLLDKLAQKGVVTKERHGATNRVSIKRD